MGDTVDMIEAGEICATCGSLLDGSSAAASLCAECARAKQLPEAFAHLETGDGQLDRELTIRELVDYAALMKSASHVFHEVTGGLVSKPNTDPAVVVTMAEDRTNEIVREAHVEAMIGVMEILGVTIGDVRDEVARRARIAAVKGGAS